MLLKTPQALSTYRLDKDCHITEEGKGDPTRLLVSGPYRTYKDVCYDNEPGRLSFMMSKHLNKYDKPWTYCMQMSSGDQCSGMTIAMNVQTLGTSLRL